MKLNSDKFIVAALFSLLFVPMTGFAADEEPPPQEISQKSDEITGEYQELKTQLLKRYEPMVEKIYKVEEGYVSIFSSDKDPASGSMEQFSPWWQTRVGQQINPNPKALQESIASLFNRAVQHSTQIKVFSDLPLIRDTAVQETNGEFDITGFAEADLADISEPVGDDLKTGGPKRYEEDSKSLEYGVKKKFITGTEVEIKQKIGDIDTNSVYFNPEEQARAGTHLIIRQPLLKHLGMSYQGSSIKLARIDAAVSMVELQRQVESHLLELARAYWALYLERTLFLQKQQLAEKTRGILKKMEGRSAVDIQPNLLARAKSQAKIHELGATQAEYAMRNAQSRIRVLVNDPVFLDSETGVEIVTTQAPQLTKPAISFEEVMQTALENRPEIAQGIHQVQAAAVRQMQAKNELRPTLDFVFDGYVKGLEGDYEYGTAYDNQFSDGDPSYLLGLSFEFPFANNSAKARLTRKRIEARQLMRQLDASVENVLLEVQVSYREMQKYYESMIQSYQIMDSDQEEIQELLSRIDYQLSSGQPYGDMLYRLMDASERLTKSEETFAKSELTYNLAIYNIYRAMGVLVSRNDITFTKDVDDEELPVLIPTSMKKAATKNNAAQ